MIGAPRCMHSPKSWQTALIGVDRIVYECSGLAFELM